MRIGTIATVTPSDADDPLANQWAGEKVKVLRTRPDAMNPMVYASLVEPINGQSPRLVFRERDLQEFKPLCVFCDGEIEEAELATTNAGPAHEDCAEKRYGYDHGDSVYPH